jgi:hypothetical protein
VIPRIIIDPKFAAGMLAVHAYGYGVTACADRTDAGLVRAVELQRSLMSQMERGGIGDCARIIAHEPPGPPAVDPYDGLCVLVLRPRVPIEGCVEVFGSGIRVEFFHV